MISEAILEDPSNPGKLFKLFENDDPQHTEESDPQLNLKLETGQQLIQARETLGLSVSDIATELLLSEDFILAIERRDYSKLPSVAYATGYVRAYATLVKLNPDEMVKADPDLGLGAIDEEADIKHDRTNITVMEQSSDLSMTWLPFVIKALLVVVLLSTLLTAWNFRGTMITWWNDRFETDKVIQIEEGDNPSPFDQQSRIERVS